MSSSTTESANFDFEIDWCSNSGAGMFGWWTFMKLTLMKKGFFDLAASSRKPSAACSIYLSTKGIPTTPFSGVSTYWPLSLKSSVGGLTCLTGKHALRDFLEHGPCLWAHSRKPSRISVGVGIEVIKADIFHNVVALGVRQRVIRFSQAAIFP